MLYSRIKHKRRILSFCFLLFIGIFMLIYENVMVSSENGHVDDGHFNSGNSRKLLSMTLPNCTPPAIEQFPYPLMSQEARRDGGVVVHILLGAYMFLALAIACDDYFVPACEKICDALNLQSDVAGATFMAAGSSAPELATAIIGVFITQDDIGLGAVVGSAVFNIMFVIGICALFGGMVVYLHWWPMFRDCLFYTISILALVIMIYDEEVQWYEAFCLLALYVVYILIMVVNPKLEDFFVSRFSCCGYKKLNAGDSEHTETTPVKEKSGMPVTHNTFEGIDSDGESGPVEDATEIHGLLSSSLALKQSLKDQGLESTAPALNGSAKTMPPKVVVKTHLDEPDESVLSFPDGCFKRLLYVVSLPLTLLMFFTVPDCRRERWRKWWLVTFVVSCIWIAAFSYLMVWMITVVGVTFGLPDTVMGLTFIAAGASVPDAIASLLVTKDGLGDMAVSNAIGSNVFDILLCLGFPYFLKSLVFNRGDPVQVYSAGLTYCSLTLLSTVVILLVSIHLNGWKLDKKYGVFLMVLYLIFNVLAILYELNVFAVVHPPTCPSNY